MMTQAGLDALCITHLPNIRYLTQFTGSAGTAVVDGRAIHLCLDSRYWSQAQDETRQVEILQSRTLIDDDVIDFISRTGYRRVGFEARHASYRLYYHLHSRLAGQLSLQPCDGFVERIRRTKDPAEVDAISRALGQTTAAFQQTLPRLRAGMTELEAAAELEYQLRRNGSERLAFDTIVASGPRSALPHGIASPRNIEPGDVVVFDFGLVQQGYCSDFTRMVCFGQPPPDFMSTYQIVRNALETAAAGLRPDMPTDDADRLARSVIETAGFGPHFGHGTGHGLGLEIHEEPSLNRRQRSPLGCGTVFTLEPGIYLPGRFGIRIEDVACMTSEGCRVLTNFSRDPIVI